MGTVKTENAYERANDALKELYYSMISDIKLGRGLVDGRRGSGGVIVGNAHVQSNGKATHRVYETPIGYFKKYGKFFDTNGNLIFTFYGDTNDSQCDLIEWLCNR